MTFKLLAIDARIDGFDRLRKQFQRIAQGDLQMTSEAVETSIDMVQAEWVALASGVRVVYSGGEFVINRVSGSYVRSIEDGKEFPFAGDPYTGRIVSMAPQAPLIESGIQPFDMKPGMLKGRDHVTIAFRHGVPGTTTLRPMPPDVYQAAKNMAVSQVTKPKNFGASARYSWGDRLHNPFYGIRSKINPNARPWVRSNRPGAFGSRQWEKGPGYTWKTGQYHGMVRFNNAVGGSQYITFRRISRNSDPFSWMYPGVKPRPVRQVVVERTQSKVVDLIRTGFMLDMQAIGLDQF